MFALENSGIVTFQAQNKRKTGANQAQMRVYTVTRRAYSRMNHFSPILGKVTLISVSAPWPW
jgi:hypothetical protein